MKILIVSDTHRKDDILRTVIAKERPFDMMIHLGDTEGSEDYFRDWVRNDRCEIHVVRGNNDFFSLTEGEKEILIGRYRAFLTHGHAYGVSMGTEMLEEEARARHANIAMFGHTHRPCVEQSRDGFVLLNPGSLAYPRQKGRQPSYLVMDIDNNGEAKFEICYAKEENEIF